MIAFIPLTVNDSTGIERTMGYGRERGDAVEGMDGSGRGLMVLGGGSPEAREQLNGHTRHNRS